MAPRHTSPKESGKATSVSNPIQLRLKSTNDESQDGPSRNSSRVIDSSVRVPVPGSPRPGSIHIRQVIWLAVALLAICIALSAWIVVLQAETRSNQRELASITQERDTLRQQATATSYHLAPTAAGPENAAAVVFLTVEGSGVLSATNLPKLGTNQAFQLWYRPSGGGAFIPGGTFSRDEQGNGFMPIPSDVGRFEALSISIEPASGSTVPGGAMILQGDVNGVKG